MAIAKVKIVFGRSSSPNFQNALSLAEKLPTYISKGKGKSEKHSIKLDLLAKDIKYASNLLNLLEYISSWKSTALYINGAKLDQLWLFQRTLAQVCSCYAERRSLPRGDDYCCGKDAPDQDKKFFGCRLEKGINYHDKGYSYGNQAQWYQFGSLSKDLSRYNIDKKLIIKTLRAYTEKEPCMLCPAFSWERLLSTANELPNEIDLKGNKDFVLKYSFHDSTKPLGIHKRREGHAIRVGFTAKDDSELQSERNVPKIKYSDVAAQDRAIEEIDNIIGLPLKHPDYFSEVCISPHTGIILYGPPGNGKTLIAKAVACEANAHLEIINGPEILSKYWGESESNLRRVFDRAKKSAPSIILIDEIDSFAPSRDKVNHQAEISLISQLLVLLDGLKARGKVAVIATTNRIEAVDSALRRPGRFDYHIEVPKPGLQGRIDILKVHLKNMKVGRGIDLSILARRTDGFSGAELAAVCREAGLLVIRRAIKAGMKSKKVSVLKGDLLAAVDSIKSKRLAS